MGKKYAWETKYQIIDDSLGEGGNGKVFRVQIIGSNDNFALKQLIATGKEKNSRFVTEIKTVNEYSGKVSGIIPIFDFSEE